MGVCLRLKAINWRTLGFWFNCKLEPTREEHSFFSGLHDVSADSPSPYSSVLGHMCSVTSVMSLCGPVDCSPPGSSVHGTLQVRTLEWVPFPSPGDLPDPDIEPRSPALQADSHSRVSWVWIHAQFREVRPTLWSSPKVSLRVTYTTLFDTAF